MKRKIAALIVLMAVMLFTVGAVAWAETVEGEGTITAHGVGIALVRGKGTIDISGHGVGTVWISGADDLKVTGHGYRHNGERGVLLVGWDGRIHAAGEHLNVRMMGGFIDFTATGQGTVFLRGDGWFRIDDHEGRWPPHGRRARLGTPPAPPES